MPKTYTEGHKAREITLAEAAIVKLRDGLTAAVSKHETEREKGKAMHARANAMIEAADRKLNGARTTTARSRRPRRTWHGSAPCPSPRRRHLMPRNRRGEVIGMGGSIVVGLAGGAAWFVYWAARTAGGLCFFPGC